MTLLSGQEEAGCSERRAVLLTRAAWRFGLLPPRLFVKAMALKKGERPLAAFSRKQRDKMHFSSLIMLASERDRVRAANRDLKNDLPFLFEEQKEAWLNRFVMRRRIWRGANGRWPQKERAEAWAALALCGYDVDGARLSVRALWRYSCRLSRELSC